MLNEPSAFLSGDESKPEPEKPVASQDSVIGQIELMVSDVMDVYSLDYDPPPPAAVQFVGKLRISSEQAYAQLDEQFKALDFHVVLRTDDQDRHVIIALKGRIKPKPRPLWPHVVLFVLTILSLLYVGAQYEVQDGESLFLLDGWPFAVSMILILGTHELGHYFTARYHRMNVSLPYFIPFPLHVFGTLGAFILFREPSPNRKIMFDIGVAGPLAGLVVAIPILFIGLATSDIEPLPQDQTYMVEGDSLLYITAKYVVFGEFLPDGERDVFVNQVAWAGWIGLLLTGLNLIPAGQLDGGHVVSTLLGKRAQALYWPLVVIFVALSMLNSVWWVLTFLLLMFGRYYAAPLDNVTPLDRQRRRVAYIALMLFILIFVPLPLRIVTP